MQSIVDLFAALAKWWTPEETWTNSLIDWIKEYAKLNLADIDNADFDVDPKLLYRHISKNARATLTLSQPRERADVYTGTHMYFLDNDSERDDISMLWFFLPTRRLRQIEKVIVTALLEKIKDTPADEQLAYAKSLLETLVDVDTEAMKNVRFRGDPVQQLGNRAVVDLADTAKHGIYIAMLFTRRRLHGDDAVPGHADDSTEITRIGTVGPVNIYASTVYRVAKGGARNPYLGIVSSGEQVQDNMRIPILEQRGLDPFVIQQLADDGDDTADPEFWASIATLLVLRGTSDGGYMYGYRGDMLYSARNVYEWVHPPLLAPHEPTSIALMLQPSAEVDSLHIAEGEVGSLMTKLAWYRGTVFDRASFVGYSPLPESVVDAEAGDWLNTLMITRAEGVILNAMDHVTTFSLWAVTVLTNPLLSPHSHVYSKRCVQHSILRASTLVNSLSVRVTRLSAADESSRAYSLPSHVDRYRALTEYPESTYRGYTTPIDWSFSLQKLNPRLVSGEYEPLYVASTDTYRGGLMRGVAYTLRGDAADRSVPPPNDLLRGTTWSKRALEEDARVLTDTPEGLTGALAHLTYVSLFAALVPMLRNSTAHPASADLVTELKRRISAIRHVAEGAKISVDSVPRDRDIHALEEIQTQADIRLPTYDRSEDTIGRSFDRYAEMNLNPYYLPHYIALMPSQQIMVEAEVIDDAFARYIRHSVSLDSVLESAYSPAVKEIVKQYFIWRNRFHTSVPYPKWFREDGVRLLYTTYYHHLVEWTATDGRTLAPFDPVHPPAWGALTWKAPPVREHALLRELRVLYDASAPGPFALFLHRAFQATTRYARAHPHDYKVPRHVHTALSNLTFDLIGLATRAALASRTDTLRKKRAIIGTVSTQYNAHLADDTPIDRLLSAIETLDDTGHVVDTIPLKDVICFQDSAAELLILYPGASRIRIPVAGLAPHTAVDVLTAIADQLVKDTDFAYMRAWVDTGAPAGLPELVIDGIDIPAPPALAVMRLSGTDLERDLAKLYIASLRTGQLDTLMRTQGIEGRHVASSFDHFVTHELLYLHQPAPNGFWVGQHDVTRQRAVIVNTTERVLARLRILMSVPEDVQHILLNAFSAFPLPRSDVYVPVIPLD